jgi:hypothetical protein
MAAEPDPQQLLTVLTTEHFTLQGARAQTVSESAARASLYLFSVSALVALPTLYVLGLFTFVRLVQSVAEDFQYGRAINRIRHHYLEVAGSKADLFMMSAHRRRARGARQHGHQAFDLAGVLHEPDHARRDQQRRGRQHSRDRGRVGEQRDRRQCHCVERHPDGDERSLAEARDEFAGDLRHDDRHRAPGIRRRPASSGP